MSVNVVTNYHSTVNVRMKICKAIQVTVMVRSISSISKLYIDDVLYMFSFYF